MQGHCIVLHHLLRAVCQLHKQQSLLSRRVAWPAYQVVHHASHHLAVEKQLHFLLSLLPRVGYWQGSRLRPYPPKEGLEAVDADSQAVEHLAWQGEGASPVSSSVACWHATELIC